MLKFDRKKKKLVIPVGINPSFGNDASTNYNTTDADVVANDVIVGKIAYGADGRLVGTLDIESEITTSYNEGYQAGESAGYQDGLERGYQNGFDNGIIEQKRLLTNITITENGTYTREDGYNEVIVEVPDLNGDYNEGYSDGVVAGREEIITEQSDATITPQTVFKGEIGYGANNERIVGEYEFVEGFDFGEIGYSQEESNEVNRDIGDDIAYSKTFYDRWNNETGPYFSSFFRNNKTLKYVPNINIEKSINTLADSAFSGCENIIYVPMLNTSKFTNMSAMFSKCSNLSSLPLFDTSNVNNMQQMFYSCSSLTSVPLFDTSKVTKMSSMFQSCSNLTSVPLFDTSNVTDMNSMFYYCSNLTSVPLFNTSKVTNIANMFYSCSSLTSVPLFDTSKVTNMSGVFNYCDKLTSVPKFDTGSATTLQNMFYSCESLTSVPLFNTSNATTLQNMFYETSVTECPAFNTSNVTNADGFLNGCSKMVTINLLDFSKVNKTGGLGGYNTLNGLKELINVAGFINFGKGFTGSTANGFTLTSSTKLTVESCLNIFNNLYDMNLNTAYTGTPTIQLSSTTKALLSADDIAIATSKGWTIK